MESSEQDPVPAARDLAEYEFATIEYDYKVHPDAARRIRLLFDQLERDVSRSPIPMILYCPNCGRQHVDAPDEAKGWSNPPHRSHLCPCGCVFRPADVCTVGVESIKTCGKEDNWIFAYPEPAIIAERGTRMPTVDGHYWFKGRICNSWSGDEPMEDTDGWVLVHFDTEFGPTFTMCGTEATWSPEELDGVFVGPLAEPQP